MRRLGRVGVAAVLMLVALWTGGVAQATEVLSCADGGVCVVGDTGPGGGPVFYVAASPFASPGSGCDTTGVGGVSTCTYLEAAPSDQSSGIAWATTAAFCYNSDGTTSTNNCQSNSIYSGNSAAQSASRTASQAIGMGMSNTNQIYARLTTAGRVTSSSYAAGMAWAYSNNSKTDWFLPSKLELNQLCRYARNLTVDNASTTCSDMTGSVRSGFVYDYYWSSSEFSNDGGWAQYFGYGSQSPTVRDAGYYVRPVRAFSTTPLLAPAFTLSSSSGTATQNVAIASLYTISSTGGAIASYSISPAAPAGTSFDTSTGLLSGTPTTLQSATPYTIRASNATSSASQTFSLAVSLPCASGGPCVVGDPGPGGGPVFYVAASPFASPGSACNTNGVGGISTCKYLEAAPAGWIVSSTPASQTNCISAGNTTVDPGCQWSGNTSTAVGTTGTAIGVGHANTTAIIAQSDGGSTAGMAATASRAYQGGSKTDWFLPSQLELNQLCRYAWNLAVDNTATTCSDMTGSIRTGFSADSHWSSSEFDLSIAWKQAFENGSPSNDYGKAAAYKVRPVRAFSSTAVSAPGAPLQPTVVLGIGRATVTVAAGSGGLPDSYMVRASPQVGGVTKTCRVTGSSGSCIVGGLTNGQAYTFTASASNASGTSAASSASASVTPLGVPAFTLSSTSETKAQNVAITGYTITSTGGAIASYSITPPAPAGTVFSTVTGLLSGTPTTARPPTRYGITATNAMGFARSFFTLAVTAVAPGAPLRPTVVARNTRVDVSVVAGVGGLPTSFLVEASPQVAGVTRRCKQSTGESFCIVQGLTNGVAYTFTATANNAIGRSVASSASVAATPTERSCATGGPCAVGDTGRGGGIVFYVSASPFASPGSDCNTSGVGGATTCKYLEAAPSDQSSSTVWATAAVVCFNPGSLSSTNNCETNSIYSGDSTAQATSRTASLDFGMGMSNTNDIYARLTTAGSVATTDYAAGIAWAYSNNSKTDWFLPSQLQLNELCKYARTQTTGTTSVACASSGSLRTGFSAQRYWSSTELFSAYPMARSMHFNDGSLRTSGKSSTYYVRPVRAF